MEEMAAWGRRERGGLAAWGAPWERNNCRFVWCSAEDSRDPIRRDNCLLPNPPRRRSAAEPPFVVWFCDGCSAGLSRELQEVRWESIAFANVWSVLQCRPEYQLCRNRYTEFVEESR